MAAAKMRHHNSPEEVAKRAGAGPEPARNRKDFRHYNHPAEIAKRAASGQGGGQAVPAKRRIVQAPAEPFGSWLPPGTVDNTASVSVRQLDAEAGTREALATLERDQLEGDGDVSFSTRLRKLEVLLYTFVDDVREAREFRRLLSNQQAVTDGMASVGERLNAIELTLEAAMAEAGEGDEADEVDEGTEADEGAPEGASEPPATVPDVPRPAGAE
jgi:hypothetical protein